MLVELGIASLVALAAYKATKTGPGIMTPERRKIFTHALNKNDPPLTPEALLSLADVLDGEGLTAYSEVVRKRAAMRAQPPAVKAAHRAAYRKAMGSTDPANIRIAANAFESQGKTAMAAALRNQADVLDQAALQAVVGPAGSPGAAASAAGPHAASIAAGPAATATAGPLGATDTMSGSAQGAGPNAAAATGGVHGEALADMHGDSFGGPSNLIIAATHNVPPMSPPQGGVSESVAAMGAAARAAELELNAEDMAELGGM